jgi:high affinity Mn2+ porin
MAFRNPATTLLIGLAAIVSSRGDPVEIQGPEDWTFHAQSTYIDQWHYNFPAAYEGPESLMSAAESARTFSFSLYFGRRLWQGAEVYYNPEVFQGYGLSHTFGAAGFPNGEAVKAGFANLHYNTSRLYLRQVIGLGGEKEKIEDDADQLSGEVDVNRIVVSVGKFSAGDFFDGNAYSHDSRSQFLNWTLWESAAWDYPADIVGFTGGLVVEWNTKNATLHYGLLLEPTEANGARLDHHLDEAYGQILQYDIRYSLAGDRSGTIRPFVYLNRAHMGLYSEADAETNPDITTTRAYRWKEGLGLSWDQSLTANLGAFVRLSADDGKTESFAFDEVDRSAAAGLSLKGAGWHRPDDVLGLAGAVNGIVEAHRIYLAEGGTGLLLGDGTLHYGPEQDLELYYSIHLGKWLRISPDWQYLEHPGYNRDRGGVAVYSVRAHVDY